MAREPFSAQSSVIEVLREFGAARSASDIAEAAGKHVSTVRKILRGYERDGIAGRWPGNGTAQCPDMWELVPPEHRADARRRHGGTALDQKERHDG